MAARRGKLATALSISSTACSPALAGSKTIGRLGARDADEVAHRDQQRAVRLAVLGQRRHRAVHVGGEDVDGAGGDGHLVAQPVAGEADEDVVDLEALHELLAGLDRADDAKALGAGGLRLLLRRRLRGRRR